MGSKATVHPIIKSYDLFQGFILNGREKRGKWRSPLVGNEADIFSGTVIIMANIADEIEFMKTVYV